MEYTLSKISPNNSIKFVSASKMLQINKKARVRMRLEQKKTKHSLNKHKSKKKKIMPKAFDKQNLLKQIQDQQVKKELASKQNMILRQLLNNIRSQKPINIEKVSESYLRHILQYLRKQNKHALQKLTEKQEQLKFCKKSQQYTKYLQEHNAYLVYKQELKPLKYRLKQISKLKRLMNKQYRQIKHREFKIMEDNQQRKLMQEEYKEQLKQCQNQIKQTICQKTNKNRDLARKKIKILQQINEIKRKYQQIQFENRKQIQKQQLFSSCKKKPIKYSNDNHMISKQFDLGLFDKAVKINSQKSSENRLNDIQEVEQQNESWIKEKENCAKQVNEFNKNFSKSSEQQQDNQNSQNYDSSNDSYELQWEEKYGDQNDEESDQQIIWKKDKESESQFSMQEQQDISSNTSDRSSLSKGKSISENQFL